MNNNFVQHALSRGREGELWLKQIHNIVKRYENTWSLNALPPFNLSYNYVAPVIRSDGTEAVLKIGFPQDKDFQTEIDALEVFSGKGIEKLIEADRKNAAILIERVVPGSPLSTLEDDEAATRILASIMKKLRKPLPEQHKFPSIADQSMQGISDYRKKFESGNNPVPLYLVNKAEKVFRELIATSDKLVLTHGDLHHDNILSSMRDSWLAIDPKGVAAEPAYETAAMLRNPYVKMKGRNNLKGILTKRIMVLSEELDVEAERIHRWGFAQTVLSAIWNAESPKGPDHAVFVAEALDQIKI